MYIWISHMYMINVNAINKQKNNLKIKSLIFKILEGSLID